ncbi:hypothetical protein BY996DRAFT_6419874 [Phakopsora pachyrhizi]|nr:hypothetical protein BY996DRAFT_6419874 [Phakopsora pachyrhizi]
MKATRICLIRLSDSTNRIIIIPLRTKVLPLAYENYVNHIRPRLIRGMNAFYQKVILADDPMRRTFKKIKLCYRSRLLRWIRRVREIYVTPHLNKISKKLVNNLQSIRKNNSTLKSITRNDRSEQKVPFSNAKVSKRSEDAKDSFSEQFSSASNPSDPEKSNGQGDGEEIFTDDHQRDIMKEDDKVLEGVIEDEEHSLKDDSKGDESQSTSFLENERSTLELTPETADDDHLKDRFEEGGENIVEEEEDQSYHSEQVDKSEEQIIAEGDTEPEALNFQGADYGEEYDEEDEENTEEEEDEYHQLPKDSAPDTGAELIEDVDDFIEEIKSAKSSESESSDEPKRVNRRTPEETVEDRKELERTSAEGFEKMIELESRQLEEFTIRINKKRNQQNMRRHREFVNNFERLKKIEDEAEKLLNKIEKWFIKNEIVELKTIEEKLEDVKLVVEKSREKFKVKLIDANLEEIDEFGRKEYLIENEILEECWDVVDSHAVGVQAILGGGLTWLDGVTYRDWQVYHDFRTRSKKFKSKLEDIMMGNRTEFKSKIKEYDFFSSIEGVRNQVMERYEEFVEELKRVEEKRVKRLLRMKEKREIEAEIEYKRRLEAGEDVRTAEDLKDMTEEEVRAVAADAIQSLLSKDHRSRQQVQEGSKIPVKTESFQNPSPTTVAESKRSKEKEEINKLADIARKMMIDQQQALKADNEQIKRNAPAKPNKKKPKSSSDRGNKGKGDKHSSDGKKGERVVDDGSGGSKKGRDEL